MSERPYITDRTKAWRAREIKPWFVEALDVIEKFGCQVMTVTADVVTPSFSYTTGAYDNSGRPEFITVGLPPNVAHAALNESVDRIRRGVDLTRGRHRDIVGNVEVEFHPVDPKWLHHIMLRTDWFYGGMDVPVLQLVYPDLKNRFPDETDFDQAFEQPSLSGETNHGSLAHDLWSANDPTSSLYRWKFADNPHTSAYLSQTVYEKKEPITYVSHDPDGDWQFLGDKMNEGGGPVLCCLHHPVDEDPTLRELADLLPNWYATRDKPDEPWQRFEHSPTETSANDVSADA
jgi:Domain of unknown function (DUF4262)